LFKFNLHANLHKAVQKTASSSTLNLQSTNNQALTMSDDHPPAPAIVAGGGSETVQLPLPTHGDRLRIRAEVERARAFWEDNQNREAVGQPRLTFDEWKERNPNWIPGADGSKVPKAPLAADEIAPGIVLPSMEELMYRRIMKKKEKKRDGIMIIRERFGMTPFTEAELARAVAADEKDARKEAAEEAAQWEKDNASEPEVEDAEPAEPVKAKKKRKPRKKKAKTNSMASDKTIVASGSSGTGGPATTTNTTATAEEIARLLATNKTRIALFKKLFMPKDIKDDETEALWRKLNDLNMDPTVTVAQVQHSQTPASGDDPLAHKNRDEPNANNPFASLFPNRKPYVERGDSYDKVLKDRYEVHDYVQEWLRQDLQVAKENGDNPAAAEVARQMLRQMHEVMGLDADEAMPATLGMEEVGEIPIKPRTLPTLAEIMEGDETETSPYKGKGKGKGRAVEEEDEGPFLEVADYNFQTAVAFLTAWLVLCEENDW
jgi:hypothetical protein